MTKRTMQIIIPVLIAIVAAGMWIYKNQDGLPAAADASTASAELPEHLRSADFSLTLTEPADFKALSEFGIPAIIDYGAHSCIPCKEMAPVLEKLNKEMYGRAFIKFADVWQHAEAVGNVPVQMIPTQVLINADGTPFVPSRTLTSQIKFILYHDRYTNDHVFTVHQGGLTEDQMRMILTEMGIK